jgi:hypothetical protein
VKNVRLSNEKVGYGLSVATPDINRDRVNISAVPIKYYGICYQVYLELHAGWFVPHGMPSEGEGGVMSSKG